MADWQSGIFRCLNNSFEDEKVNIFFGIYDLKIGVEQFKSFISADVICNYAYVLEFDPSSLYSIYESETKKDSDLPTLIVRRFRVSQSDLRQWWELLGDRKRALSIKFLWESALQAFPDKVVTRQAVEDLAGPRKRGRKETPRE